MPHNSVHYGEVESALPRCRRRAADPSAGGGGRDIGSHELRCAEGSGAGNGAERGRGEDRP